MADKDKKVQDGGETNAKSGTADASDPIVQHTIDSGSEAAVPGVDASNSQRASANTGDAVVDHTVESGSQAAVPNPEDAAANVKTGSGAESGVTSNASSDTNADTGTASGDTSKLHGAEDHEVGGNLVGGDDDLLDNPRETRSERTARQGERGDTGDAGEEGAV